MKRLCQVERTIVNPGIGRDSKCKEDMGTGNVIAMDAYVVHHSLSFAVQRIYQSQMDSSLHALRNLLHWFYDTVLSCPFDLAPFDYAHGKQDKH